MPNNPAAILISDIHYDLNTLELADAAMRQAIEKANELRVPLIVAGDLHNTKANLRAECVNAMIKTFNTCNSPPFIMVGNHDRINEKAPEHSLNFLRQYGAIIDYNAKLHKIGYLIPYHHDPEELKAYLKTIPKGSRLIMHQGVQDSNSGEYIQDKSALPKECFADFRVISGHYHTRQDIKCGRPQKNAVGLFSYIGNPFTLNFGEANDPEKGFQVLMDDGTLEFVPTKLRKHVVIEASEGVRNYSAHPEKGDLVCVKVRGSKEWVSTQTKEVIIKQIGLRDIPFRLDLIVENTVQNTQTKQLSKVEQLDSLIEQSDTTNECKTRLKQLWRDHAGN